MTEIAHDQKTTDRTSLPNEIREQRSKLHGLIYHREVVRPGSEKAQELQLELKKTILLLKQHGLFEGRIPTQGHMTKDGQQLLTESAYSEKADRISARYHELNPMEKAAYWSLQLVDMLSHADKQDFSTVDEFIHDIHQHIQDNREGESAVPALLAIASNIRNKYTAKDALNLARQFDVSGQYRFLAEQIAEQRELS